MLLDYASVLNVATVAVSLALAFYLWAKYKHTYWARRGVHSPPTAHWFFGHLKDAFMLKTSASRVLGDLYHHPSNKDHPVVGVYILQKPFLLLRSPSLIKQVLVKEFQNFPDRNFGADRKYDVIGTANLFGLKNPEWKYLRTKLGAAFSSGKQKALFTLMLESAENMKRFLEEKLPIDGQRVNIDARSVSTRFTTDVISSLSFGIRTNSFQQPDIEFYARSRKIFSQDIFTSLILFLYFFFPRINDFLGGTLLQDNTDYFRRVFWDSINEREKSGAKRGDAIDLLVDLKNEKQDSQFKFEGDYLVAQSIIFFTAGLETSATTMAFTLMLLAQHPEIQKKVREEIRANIIGDENMTYESVSKMTYLNQVVSETLRLFPPDSLIDRVTQQDFKIPDTDIVIEKGTIVYVPLRGLHEDPAFHPDPLTFDPDRFNEVRKKDIKPYTYMPFGEGPRICIGSRIGSMQTVVGLTTILKDYEVSVNPNFKNGVSKRFVFTVPDGEVNLYFNKSPLNKN